MHIETIRLDFPQRIQNDEQGIIFIANLWYSIKNRNNTKIFFDAKNTKKVDTNMCSPLGLILEKVKSNQNSIYFSNLSDELKMLLISNGFLNKIHMDKNKHNNKFIPYKTFNIKDRDEFTRYMEYNVLNYLKDKNIEINNKEFMRIMVEIFVNVKMHTKSKEVTTCGYYDENNNDMYFTISNHGMTIKHNIEEKNKYVFDEYIGAIEWAVKKSNSTRKKNTPGGLGLYISRNFVKDNQGSIKIISGKGYWEETNGVIVKSKEMRTTFPGTIVNFKINLKQQIKEPQSLNKSEFSMLDILEENNEVFS